MRSLPLFVSWVTATENIAFTASMTHTLSSGSYERLLYVTCALQHLLFRITSRTSTRFLASAWTSGCLCREGVLKKKLCPNVFMHRVCIAAPFSKNRFWKQPHFEEVTSQSKSSTRTRRFCCDVRSGLCGDSVDPPRRPLVFLSPPL